MELLEELEVYQNHNDKEGITNRKLFSFLYQVFIYGSVVGTISLLVPMYALKLNSNTIQVGLISGSRGMGHFLLVVPVGLLLDRFGIRRVFIISSFLSFVMVFLFPIASNPQVLLVFALLEGLTCSTRLTSLSAWSFELLPYLKPYQTGWYKGVMSVGTTIIGPITASILSEKLGFTFTFRLIASIILITNLVELFFGSSTGAKSNVKEGLKGQLGEIVSLLKMFKNPRLLFVSYAESLNTAFTTCFRILIILSIVEYMHKSSELVAIVTSCVGISYLLIVFLAGSILKYLKSTTIYIIAATIVSTALLILAFRQEIISIVFASILAGVGLGILIIVNYNTLSEVKGDSGKVSGIVTFSTGVTMCMAPMIISCVVDMSNFKVGFLALMIPFALLVVLVLTYKRAKIVKINR